MNTNIVFYQKHIHEFNTITCSLSLIEIGAFTKLIDYLILHQTLENSEKKYFLLNIKKKPEKRALDFVIEHFCYINESGDFECEISNSIIEKSQNISAERSIAGKKGAEKRTQNLINKTISNLSNCLANNNNNNNININNNKNNNNNTNNNNYADNKNQKQITKDFFVSQSVKSVVFSDNSFVNDVCLSLQDKGLQNIDPKNSKLLESIKLGATKEMFCNAYEMLLNESKSVKNPFAYIAGVVYNQITKPQHNTSNSKYNTTAFTQKQKADIIANMSNLEITNRDYLPVLLAEGYTPEVKLNDDGYSYTLLTINEINDKLQKAKAKYENATSNNNNKNVIELLPGSFDEIFETTTIKSKEKAV